MNTIILISLLIIAQSQKCASSISITTNSVVCQLYFKIAGTACSSSTFNYCDIRYCAGQSENGCTKYNTFVEKNEQNCMSYCCGGSANISNTYKAASECPNKPSKGSSIDVGKALMIIMIALGVSMIIVIIAFCIYRRFSSCNQISVMNIANPQAKIHNSKNQKMDEASIQNLLSTYKWNETSINISQLPDCQICLCERPNLKLKCGHFFHPNCFRLWLKKKFECGVCRGYDLSQVELVCQDCFKRQTRVELKDLVKLKRNYNKMICQTCKPE